MELQYIKNDGKGKKIHGRYVCPYNEECRCTRKECWKCGWNPKVAAKRSGKEEAHNE